MVSIASPSQQKPIQRTSLSDTIRGLQKGGFSGDSKMQLVQLGHGRLTGTSSNLEMIDSGKEEESISSEKKKTTKKKHIDPLLAAVKTRQKQIKGKQALTRIRRIKLTIRAAKKQQANMRRKHRKRLDRELTRAADETGQESRTFRGWHESMFDTNTKKDAA